MKTYVRRANRGPLTFPEDTHDATDFPELLVASVNFASIFVVRATNVSRHQVTGVVEPTLFSE